MSGIRILLVDDEEAFRVPMAEWLRKQGYEVDAAADGLQAVELVRQAQGNYNVILIDQVLVKGPDGIETMKRIHTKYPDLPVIIITAWGDRETGVRALREGAYRYISKPVDTDEIDILIRSIVEFREVQRKLELTEREREWLRTLLEVARVMQSKIGNLKAVLKTIVEAAKALTDADDCAISLLDPLRVKFDVYATTVPFEHPEWKFHFKKEAGSLSRLILDKGEPESIPDTEQDERINPAVTKSGIRSILGVPIGDLGVLYAYGSQPDRFKESDVKVLQLLASQAAIAIQNARLYQRAQQTLRHLQITAEFMRLGELWDVLEGGVRGIKEALDCDAVIIYWYDERQGVVIGSPVAIGVRDERRIRELRRPWPESPPGKILRLGEHFAEDALSDPVMQGEFVKQEGIRSSGGLALKVGEHTVGILFVNYRTPHCFTEEDKRIIRTFAAQAAVAIYNVELYEREKKRAEHLRRLCEASQVIAASVDRDEILNALLEKALDITAVTGERALFANIQTYDAERDGMVFTHAYPPEVLKDLTETLGHRISLKEGIDGRIGITGRAIREKATQWVSDVLEDPDYILYHPETRSEIAVPLMVGERVIGVLNAEHPEVNGLDEQDKEALEMLAAQAVLAIQKAEQIEELKRTQGLLAARTAVAWVGMASSTWRHEVNKYASTISDNVWLIRHALPKPALERIEKYLQRIEGRVKAIQEAPITAPLSAEEGVESVPVNALLKERIPRLMEVREGPEVIVKWELELPDEATVRTSREWLRRAIDILVHNSLEAMEEVPKRVLTVRTFEAEGRAEIHIADMGKGIPDEVLPKLFREPIPKKKGERGAGIGLLLAQLIAQTYGGEIGVVSTGLQGTEMAISLPLE